MRTTLFAVVAAAGSIVTAQNFAGEPACATSCLSSAISVAGCQLSDEACQCGTGFSSIQVAVEPCLLSACNQSDLAVAASVGLALCSVFSASLASASAVTTTSSAASVSSKSVVTTTSSIPVSTTSVTAVTTSVPATTSAPSTSKASSSSAARNASSSSSTSPAPVSTNAAPAIMAGMGGLLGLGVAFVAAF